MLADRVTSVAEFRDSITRDATTILTFPLDIAFGIASPKQIRRFPNSTRART
jgi:hypothetical protein